MANGTQKLHIVKKSLTRKNKRRSTLYNHKIVVSWEDAFTEKHNAMKTHFEDRTKDTHVYKMIHEGTI